MLMLREARGAGRPFVCTATMVAPNLALTARHCVSDADDTLNCRLDGQAIAGGRIHSDADPKDLRFFVGPRAPARDAAPGAFGARVIHDHAGNLCSHDLAFVLLDRPLDTPIAPMRLADEPVPGEAVRVIGWGLVNDDPETPTTIRQQRDVNVKHVGPKDLPDQFLTLTATDFGLGESICLGDSGGPVLARDNGAVIGVISHGSGCFGGGEFNVMTKITPFRTVIDAAFGSAGTLPKQVVLVGGGDRGACETSGGPADIGSVAIFSAFFLWARRRRLFAR